MTLVIGLKMRGMPTDYADESVDTFNSVDWHLTHLVKGLVHINCGSRDTEESAIFIMIDRLKTIAHFHDTPLLACVQQAYDVIAKRTGKMVDGVFVKDHPMSERDEVGKRTVEATAELARKIKAGEKIRVTTITIGPDGLPERKTR